MVLTHSELHSKKAIGIQWISHPHMFLVHVLFCILCKCKNVWWTTTITAFLTYISPNQLHFAWLKFQIPLLNTDSLPPNRYHWEILSTKMALILVWVFPLQKSTKYLRLSVESWGVGHISVYGKIICKLKYADRQIDGPKTISPLMLNSVTQVFCFLAPTPFKSKLA